MPLISGPAPLYVCHAIQRLQGLMLWSDGRTLDEVAKRARSLILYYSISTPEISIVHNLTLQNGLPTSTAKS